MGKEDGGTKIVLFESEIEKEAAKVAGAVIGRAASGVMDTVSDVFGGLIGDAIREWRTRNLVSHLARTAEILKAKGVSLDKAKALPMGEAYAMFEEASKQDDPTVAEMWSALLANAMDPALDVKVEPAFVATLRAMGPVEANVLRLIRDFKVQREKWIKELHHHGSENNMVLGVRREISRRIVSLIESIKQKYVSGISDKQFETALSNLLKERCLCIPVPVHRHRSLISRKRSSDLGSFEIVDPEKINKALNEVARSINEHSGQSDALPGFLRDDYTPIDLNFDLTDYGARLLAACEPNDPAMPV